LSRILFVPHDAGNFAPLIAKELRTQGHYARCIIFSQSYLGYKLAPPDKVLGTRTIKQLLMLELKRWWVLYHALSYDAIVFTFGSTILPSPVFIGYGLSSNMSPKLRFYYTLLTLPFSRFMWDVRLLHLLGKRIGVLFNGGDARRGDVLRARNYPDIDEEPKGYYVPFVDRLKSKRARLWDSYANVIWYHNPDLRWGLPKRSKFLGYPVEINKTEAQ